MADNEKDILEFKGRYYDVHKVMKKYKLGREEIEFLINLDVKKINDSGRYSDFSEQMNPKIIDLVKHPKGLNYIKFLRDFYNNEKIAKNIIIPRDVYVTDNDLPKLKKSTDKKGFKLTRSQRYNNGKHRVRGKINFEPSAKIIIGGILVFVIGFGTFVKADNFETNLDNSVNEMNNVGITEVSEEVNGIPTFQAYRDYMMNRENLSDELIAKIEEIMGFDKKEEEKDERQELVSKYANIYHVDYDRVYNKLVDLTDNFTNEDYLNNYHIEGVTCKSKEVYGTSEEELIALYVRCCKQLPEQLGFEDTVTVSSSYVSPDNYVEQIGDYSRLFDANPCLIYAITKVESDFKSEMFLTKNNPAGLRNSRGDFWTFSTAEEGIIETILEVQKFIDMGYDTIDKLGDIYAPIGAGDDPLNLNENWKSSVTEIYLDAENNMDELFPNFQKEEKSNNLN